MLEDKKNNMEADPVAPEWRLSACADNRGGGLALDPTLPEGDLNAAPPTPLMSVLTARGNRRMARFHMPGHKGRALLPGWETVMSVDVTELSDTGDLYAPPGPEALQPNPIAEAEALYAQAYRARDCLFLTGGATQGVLTLFSAFARPGDTVLLDRNAHRSVHNAVALCGLRPIWMHAPTLEPFGIHAPLPPAVLMAALEKHPEAAFVFVTDPTYYGVRQDISALSRLCRDYNRPLLVDAAHGAHLPWLGQVWDTPPTAAVFSAHKTLPALGQAAFLLLYPHAPPSKRARAFSSLFGSASPSYAVLSSMDAARAYLETDGSMEYARVAARVAEIRSTYSHILKEEDFPSFALDPTRLCVYTGAGASDALRLEDEFGVVCEMADPRNIVFLLTCADTEADIDRLDSALESLFARRLIPRPPPKVRATPPFPTPRQAVSPQQALYAETRTIPLSESAGQISAGLITPYPPGVPLVARGERVEQVHVGALVQRGYEPETPVQVLL